ncbi:MAG: hypothetical protein H6855_01130 [Rhodospirillales bacterium]|nr:hypothetical protein [Rhodospirillales bacterium]MCB9964672.1 hypothetical protein [Rhodospirillales bacterium]MCB9979962.1 hypothetical protein [Rhodospirillales bacterium]
MRTLRDETLADLLKALWSARVYVASGAVAGMILAGLVVLFAVPCYRVQMVIAPVSESASAGDAPGGASGAFITQAADQKTFASFLRILSGPNVIKSVLERDQNILPALQEVRRFTFQSGQDLSAPEDVSQFLTQAVRVKAVGETSLRTLELELPDPQLARQILFQLHQTADHILRTEAEARTDKRLAYLKETLARTANPDHRQALTSLLMEQERQAMILRMDKYFAADIVEPPFVTPRPVWPRKSYLFPLGALIGMMLGWVIYGIARSYR